MTNRMINTVTQDAAARRPLHRLPFESEDKMKNKKCIIKKDWLNPNEPQIEYCIKSEPNINDQIDIEPVIWDWPIKPIQSVNVNMVEVLS